jgi:O-methyltransferase
MKKTENKATFGVVYGTFWWVAGYVRPMLESCLFQMYRIFTKGNPDTSKHSIIISQRTYSPWLSDKQFRAAFDVVMSNTMVGEQRCYELWHLVGQVRHLEHGDIIEIGTWRGGTGCLLAIKAQQDQIPCSVYLCDTFQGVVKSSDRDSVYRDGEHSDTSLSVVNSLLRRASAHNVKILKGVFPEETAGPLSDHRFRLCHIDVDVYQAAKDALDWVWRRLELGGIVVFDDYGSHMCPGITELVNRESCKPDRVMIHNTNGHAILIKRS